MLEHELCLHSFGIWFQHIHYIHLFIIFIYTFDYWNSFWKSRIIHFFARTKTQIHSFIQKMFQISKYVVVSQFWKYLVCCCHIWINFYCSWWIAITPFCQCLANDFLCKLNLWTLKYLINQNDYLNIRIFNFSLQRNDIIYG